MVISERMERVLRECAKEDGTPIPEDESIEDWLIPFFLCAQDKRAQEWVDKHRIHNSEQKPKEPEGRALQMNVAYIAKIKRGIEELERLMKKQKEAKG